MQSAFGHTSLALLILLVHAAPATAQVDDHLRCYKIADPLRLKGVVDVASHLGLEPGCTIKRGAFFCVPATKTVIQAAERNAPITPLPISGTPETENRICYKFKCDAAPPPQDVTDQFGARTVTPKGVGLLCTPAVEGLVDPECGSSAHCDDGDPCNGFEQCVDFQCQPGTPVDCQPGDLVFAVPYQGAPQPATQDLTATPVAQNVDIYLLLDRSGSMSTEISTIRSNAATVVNGVGCPPFGTGSPGSCIPSVWAGAGTIGYAGAAGSYGHHLDLQPNANFSTVPITEPAGCCTETHLLAAWSTVTGAGSATSGCSGLAVDYPARGSCSASPAGGAGAGYPCFRPDSLPLILLATDEAPTQSLNCPTIGVTAAAATTLSARIIGLLGSGSGTQVRNDLEALAVQTGAVDAANTPLVFDAADANAAAALEAAVLAAHGAPLSTRAVFADDPSDAVDTAAFLDRVETLQLGTPECADGLTAQDSDADGAADEYAALPAGTPVCWRVHAGTNTTVPATTTQQVFTATVGIEGARRAAMGQRRVLFVVPPAP